MNTKLQGKIVLAGGSGFLGKLLAEYFSRRGFEIVVLTRKPRLENFPARVVEWDGETIGDWAREMDGAVAVINLAGVSVNCRYTASNRRKILDSRILSTRVVGQAIWQCPNPPRVWLNSSAVTIYRHNFGPAWDEAGEIGAAREAKDAFSIEVAEAWERALSETPTPKTRKIALRSAMVVGLGGNSVFPVLRRLVRLGLGGEMASGKQYVSWIHETDFCRAVEWLIKHDDINGVVNLAAPDPLTNEEMMRTLRRVCGRTVGLPAAMWMLEIGAFFLRTETELIIKSRRVISTRLPESGFKFDFQNFYDAATDLNQKFKT